MPDASSSRVVFPFGVPGEIVAIEVHIPQIAVLYRFA